MDIHSFVHKRFTAKKYDPDKKIPDTVIRQLIDLLRYTPTSINSQPYHFIVASTKESINHIAKSMDNAAFLYNKGKVTDSSHTVVICSKTDMDESYIRKIVQQEITDGRHRPGVSNEQMIQTYCGYLDMHKSKHHDLDSWMGKQCYIALGNLLLGASLVGVDASPLEGFDQQILDKEFDLASKGYTSLVVITLGYHSENDYNAHQPKSRFPEKELFTLC